MTTKKGKGLAALLEDAETQSSERSLKFIKIKDIVPNPLNPRKDFEQGAMEELMASILKIGVIQPITVRPFGDKYELVCGERRYRAALSVNAAHKERNEIPASIRNLTDEEAMELMVTENLQRKDVHPMEEADAFQFMMEKMKYTITDIAAKIGKAEPFVLRRLQLRKLVADLQAIFITGVLPIGHAELLSKLETEDQQAWYKDYTDGLSYNGMPNMKKLKQWLQSNTQNELSKAPFDINADFTGRDTVRSIACTQCPNNTAVSCTLFPEDPTDAICTFKACYKSKAEAAFSENLKNALADKTVLLFGYSYGAEMKKYIEKGYTCLMEYDHFSMVYGVPDPDDMNLDRDDYESDEEYQEELELAKQNYAAEVEEFESNKGAYSSGFMMTGHNRGQYIFYTLKANVSGAVVSEAGTNKQQIEQIEEKRKRGLELDQEKVMKKVVDLMKVSPISKETTSSVLSKQEGDCLIALAYEFLGYGDIQKEIAKLLGLDKSYATYNRGPEIVEAISKASDSVRALIVRAGLLNHYQSINPRGLGGGVIFHLACDWLGDQYKDILAEQEAVRVKRETRLNEKIAELKAETNGGG
jgi:ParB/RepB/Spo0J family partition protein